MEENKIQYTILVTSFVLLVWVYHANMMELFKLILTWAFALTGFELIYQRHIISRLTKVNERIGEKFQEEMTSGKKLGKNAIPKNDNLVVLGEFVGNGKNPPTI